MIPIQDLLNRIRWDKEFGKGDFLIGYYDRELRKTVRVSYAETWVDTGDHFSFQFMDEEGECHTVPLHRIRELYRNGELIWHREG
jgi:uncharacterized protein (UPF0248 family)